MYSTFGQQQIRRIFQRFQGLHKRRRYLIPSMYQLVIWKVTVAKIWNLRFFDIFLNINILLNIYKIMFEEMTKSYPFFNIK